MRLLASNVAMLAVFASVSAVSAETLAGRVVTLLNDVCVKPANPEAMVAAGDRLAAAEGWKVVQSGATPMPMLHHENGAKVSYTKTWDIGLSEGARLHLGVSILRPEMPGVKYSLCAAQPSVDIDRDSLRHAIDGQFGSIVTKDMSGRFTASESWFFAEEKARGNCGKQITVLLNQISSRGKPKALIFTDFAFPNNGEWSGILSSTKCPS